MWLKRFFSKLKRTGNIIQPERRQTLCSCAQEKAETEFRFGVEVCMGESHSPSAAGHYNANYGNFETTLYAQIRHEAFGEDIGQNSWLTAEEQDSFLEWLDLRAGKKLLDIACGAGGPTLRV